MIKGEHIFICIQDVCNADCKHTAVGRCLRKLKQCQYSTETQFLHLCALVQYPLCDLSF